MIYLDNGATSLHKPPVVERAMVEALRRCANPGRGGHLPAMEAAQQVFRTRLLAAEFFHCSPEQVVFTHNCTHGLNTAIFSLIKPGARVVISGFEHNAVVRPLHALGAKLYVAGQKLFDPADTLQAFIRALDAGAEAAVFTHVSNVFGYILPVEKMAQACKERGIPFILDAAQSAGVLPVDFSSLGAEYIAMPGHKGLLGPQGTGILLCAREGKPLLYGGTGSHSRSPDMPQELPERMEAGTLNVPGIAGLGAAISWLMKKDLKVLHRREARQAALCAIELEKLGYRVFSGEYQSGTVSFVPEQDCEEFAMQLGKQGIAVRAGLHCAPLAHQSAGTISTGTVRISFGADASDYQREKLVQAMEKLKNNLH